MRRQALAALALLASLAGCGGEGAEAADAQQDQEKLERMYEQGQLARDWMQRHSATPTKKLQVTAQQCQAWFDNTSAERISSDEGFRGLARAAFVQGCLNGGEPGDRRPTTTSPN